MNLEKDIKGTRKSFYRYISSERKTRENAGLLLNGSWELKTNKRENTKLFKVHTGDCHLERRWAEKCLGTLVSKHSTSQQYVFAAKKAKRMLDSISKSTTNLSSTAILLLYSALLKAYLECCVMFWVPHYKKIMNH